MLERKTGFCPEGEASPVNWASVFQEASNLLPPDDYGPPQPPQPNQPLQLEMGSYLQSEHFIKTRSGLIATPRGSVTILTATGMGTYGHCNIQEENLNGTTSNKTRCKKILKSYLCCCNDKNSR